MPSVNAIAPALRGNASHLPARPRIRRLLRAGFVLAAVGWGQTAPAAEISAGAVSSRSNPAATKESGDPAGRLAAEIDRLIAARWAEEKVEPALPASDAEFLRRTYLNVVGRIPSASEVQLFLEDGRKDKRRQIVENLLDSPAYPTHFADIVRSIVVPEANTDVQLAFQSGPFNQWLRRRFAENAGYDRIAKDLLTAPIDANGPGFYFLAKAGKPENIAGGAARVFLGTRIECAQCHNHPFAKWRREQFWQFAAFFAGIKAEPEGPIRDSGQPAELKIPDTNKIVKARYLDDSVPKWGASPQPRKTLADWLTADENPYFARAAVNRIWAHFLGTGIVDPVDDFDEANVPSHPELLDTLAREFVRHRYDVKFLIRAICASRAYQLTTVESHPGQANRRLFARMPVKGLSPAELVASLSQAAGEYDGVDFDQFAVSAFYGQSGLRSMVMQIFKNDTADAVDREATILQALALMNSTVIDQTTGPGRGNTLSAVLDAPFLDSAGRVEMLFLATLSRRPTRGESERLVKYVEKGGTHSTSKPKLGNVFQQMISNDKGKTRGDQEVALGDVFWALLNSTEFLTNH